MNIDRLQSKNWFPISFLQDDKRQYYYYLEKDDPIYATIQVSFIKNKTKTFDEILDELLKKKLSKKGVMHITLHGESKTTNIYRFIYMFLKGEKELICVDCKSSTKKNHIVHIDGKNENNNPDNLICLCASCHNKKNAHDNKTYKIEELKNNNGKKECIKCSEKKPIDEFWKNSGCTLGSENTCITCRKKNKYEYDKTLRGFLKKLLHSSKYCASLRKNRSHASIFTLTYDDLEKKYEIQNGMCFYSGIKMNHDKRDWSISVERIDNDKGYTFENIVLCCKEFNDRCQWTREKIIELIDIKEKNVDTNFVSFELHKNEGKRRRIKQTMILENGIQKYKCNNCNIIKPMCEFYVVTNGCKDCSREKYLVQKNTPRFFLQRLIANARSHSKQREKKHVDKRCNKMDINFEFLVDIFNSQNGLCAYSGIPLTFGSYLEKNWVCSLERKNVFEGYNKENCCLVCTEFNTSDKTIVYKDTEIDQGNAGWSKEKFNFFYKTLKNELM